VAFLSYLEFASGVGAFFSDFEVAAGVDIFFPDLGVTDETGVSCSAALFLEVDFGVSCFEILVASAVVDTGVDFGVLDPFAFFDVFGVSESATGVNVIEVEGDVSSSFRFLPFFDADGVSGVAATSAMLLSSESE
jgi:hypothetical protein